MTRRVALLFVLALLVAPAPALACPICFGGGDASALLDAARSGVLVMVALTLTVLVAFARWFLRLRALARKHDAEGR